MTRALCLAVGLVAVLIAGALGKRRYDAHIAADVRRELADSARRDTIAALRAREATSHVDTDSLAMAARPDSVHLAAIAPRITLRSPTMIAVDTTSPGAPPAPPVLVTVPSSVTDLIDTQARRIVDLEGQLRVALVGWARADSVIAMQDRRITDIERRTASHWYDRLTVAVGYGCSVGAQAACGPTVAAGVTVWRP